MRWVERSRTVCGQCQGRPQTSISICFWAQRSWQQDSPHQESFAELFGWQRTIFKADGPDANLSGKNPAFTFTADAAFSNDGLLQAQSQDIEGTDAYGGSLLQFRDGIEAARSAGKGPVIIYETGPQLRHEPMSAAQSALQLWVELIGGAKGLFLYSYGTTDKERGFESDDATPPEIRARILEIVQTITHHQRELAAPRNAAHVAVVVSMAAAIQSDGYSRRLVQTYDLLRNQHYAVDFLWNRDLLRAGLDRYDAIVLPSLTMLSADELKALDGYQAAGGHVLAFAHSLERDELFRPVPLPALIGISSRGPPRWGRDFARMTDVVPELAPYTDGEITVQDSESIGGEPQAKALPGARESPETQGSLAAGQDGGALIHRSPDGRSIYAAFDSLYSDELSRLLGGLFEQEWKIPREVSIRSVDREAVEVLEAVNEDGPQRVVLLANSAPHPGRWTMSIPGGGSSEWRSLRTGRPLRTEKGAVLLELESQGWDAVAETKRR